MSISFWYCCKRELIFSHILKSNLKILISDSSSYVLPRTDDQDNPMLPCEFCEGMIPMRKLLEHQVRKLNQFFLVLTNKVY